MGLVSVRGRSNDGQVNVISSELDIGGRETCFVIFPGPHSLKMITAQLFSKKQRGANVQNVSWQA